MHVRSERPKNKQASGHHQDADDNCQDGDCHRTPNTTEAELVLFLSVKGKGCSYDAERHDNL